MYETQLSITDSDDSKHQQREQITKIHERNKIIIELSSLDVDRLDDDSIDAVSDYFCIQLNSIRDSLIDNLISIEILPFLMTICRIALQLSIRKQKFDADCTKLVTFLLNYTKEKSNLDKNKIIKMQTNYPIKPQNLLQVHKNDLKFIEVALSTFNSPALTLDYVFRYSIYFSTVELNFTEFKNLDLINVMNASNPDIAEEISDHVVNFHNLDSLIIAVHKLPTIDDPFNYLILRFLYESLFKCRLTALFNVTCFYQNLLDKILSSPQNVDVQSLLPVFAHVAGDPIHVPLSLSSTLPHFSLFCVSLYVSHLTCDRPFRGQIPTPLPLCCLLIAIQRGNREVLNRHVVETAEIAIFVISQFMEISPYLYSLIHASMKGDVNSSKMLLRHPECIGYLHPEKSRLHKIVSTLFANEVDLPNTDSISIQMAASIFRLRQLKRELPFQYVHGVLRTAHEKLTVLTTKLCGKSKNKIHLLFAGFSTNQNIRAFSMKLKSKADFVSTAADNSFESIGLTIMTMLPFIPKNIQQKDKEMTSILADLSLHFCLGDKLHAMMNNYFSDTFAKNRQERQIFHIISSLEDKTKHEETLCVIAAQFQDQQILEAVTSYFIRNCDTSLIFMIISKFGSKIGLMNISMKIDIFELMIKNASLSDEILKFSQSLINSCDASCRHSLFRILGMFSLSKAANVLAVIESVELSIDDVVDMIESIPQFEGELQGEFVVLLKKIIDKLPLYKFVHQRNKNSEQLFSSDWSEDPSKSSNDLNGIDPWKPPKTASVCVSIQDPSTENCDQKQNKSLAGKQRFPILRTDSMSASSISKQPVFCCNSCGVKNICLNCALTCHSSHDISFIGFDQLANNACSCFNNSNSASNNSPRTCNCLSKHLNSCDFVQVPNLAAAPISYVPFVPGTLVKPRVSSATLIKLALSLSRSTAASHESPVVLQHQKNLSCPIKELELQSIKQCRVAKSCMSFVPVDKIIATSAPLAEVENIASSIVAASENQQQIGSRLSVSPLSISAVSGNFLIIAEGTKLKSYKIEENSPAVSLSEVSSIAIPAPALSISLSPLDPTIIAVSTLKRALIYTLNTSDGSFSLMNEIELMLDSLGPKIFINSIHWIPLAPLHVAVVCNKFVKVYDVPTDCIAPISCIVPGNSNDCFTSAVFVENDDECVGFLALSSGQIAVQNMFEDSGNGTQKPKSFMKMPGIPLQPIISYSPESDLFFITGPGAVMKALKLSDFLSKKLKPAISLNFNRIPGELSFLGTLPTNDAFHIFVHPNSGSLVSIEFTDKGVEAAPLNNDYPRPPVVPLFENRMQVISTFSIGNSFYAIESDGAVSALKYGGADESRDVDIDYKVPATFWTISQSTASPTFSSNSIQMKAPNVQENCRLFAGESVTFSSSDSPKVVEVSSTNSSQLIVGFCITVKNPPPKGSFVICHGRATPLSEHVSIPLRKSEVKLHVTHRIEFYCPTAESLTVNRINVHVIDFANFVKIPQNLYLDFDWRKGSANLFDFADVVKRSANPIHTIYSRCILAIVADDSNIDSDTVKQLVNLIYSRPDLALAARSALCRISKDRNRFASIWAAELNDMINNSEVNESQWEIVWRDYQAMPSDCKKILEKAIWQKAPKKNGIDLFVSAFL